MYNVTKETFASVIAGVMGKIYDIEHEMTQEQATHALFDALHQWPIEMFELEEEEDDEGDDLTLESAMRSAMIEPIPRKGTNTEQRERRAAVVAGAARRWFEQDRPVTEEKSDDVAYERDMLRNLVFQLIERGHGALITRASGSAFYVESEGEVKLSARQHHVLMDIWRDVRTERDGQQDDDE